MHGEAREASERSGARKGKVPHPAKYHPRVTIVTGASRPHRPEAK